jgi:hypothetical protein
MENFYRNFMDNFYRNFMDNFYRNFMDNFIFYMHFYAFAESGSVSVECVCFWTSWIQIC